MDDTSLPKKNTVMAVNTTQNERKTNEMWEEETLGRRSVEQPTGVVRTAPI